MLCTIAIFSQTRLRGNQENDRVQAQNCKIARDVCLGDMIANLILLFLWPAYGPLVFVYCALVFGGQAAFHACSASAIKNSARTCSVCCFCYTRCVQFFQRPHPKSMISDIFWKTKLLYEICSLIPSSSFVIM